MKLEFFMGSFTLLQYFLWHFFLIECKKKVLSFVQNKVLGLGVWEENFSRRPHKILKIKRKEVGT